MPRIFTSARGADSMQQFLRSLLTVSTIYSRQLNAIYMELYEPIQELKDNVQAAPSAEPADGDPGLLGRLLRRRQPGPEVRASAEPLDLVTQQVQQFVMKRRRIGDVACKLERWVYQVEKRGNV